MAWFSELKRSPRPLATLFCFHFGGGSSGAFRPWARHLPEDLRLVGVDLPGRAARFGEPPLTDTGHAVDALLREDEFLAPRAPFVLFGHSLGAVLAFELTRALERARRCPPLHLVVSGRRAPHLPHPRKPIYDLPDAAFVEELRKYQGTPEEVLQNADLMALFLPLLKADFAMSESYRYVPSGPLDTPLTVLGGGRDPMVDASGLGEWAQHTRSSCEVRTFDDGHFFIDAFGADIVRLMSEIVRKGRKGQVPTAVATTAS